MPESSLGLSIANLVPQQVADELCQDFAVRLSSKLELMGIDFAFPASFQRFPLHQSCCLITDWAKTGKSLTLELAEQNLRLILDVLYDQQADAIWHNYQCFGSPHVSGGVSLKSWELALAAAFARHAVLTTGVIGRNGFRSLTGKSDLEVETLHNEYWDKRGGRVNAFAPEKIQALLAQTGVQGF
ncbi:hypothetical protein ACQ4M3_12940 [Leptolyngbya sp. AN03gr2]|uniref:hypothetical protein n=1 Tax=unclassified Leptolyngbya TaxID=2650499 RepID=UPI003D3140EA